MKTQNSDQKQYMGHLLNTSPCKTCYSFNKSKRFVDEHSYAILDGFVGNLLISFTKKILRGQGGRPLLESETKLILWRKIWGILVFIKLRVFLMRRRRREEDPHSAKAIKYHFNKIQQCYEREIRGSTRRSPGPCQYNPTLKKYEPKYSMA